jgi:hypothetical protein
MIAAFLSLGERLVQKQHTHFDQLMAYRPSRQNSFQVGLLSQPPFLFLST